MKKYFLVYNDGTHNRFLDRLLESVRTHNNDFEIIVFDKEQIDNDFRDKNTRILNECRGGGYWLWKPYIINETMKRINDGDLLFYLDSKYFFMENFTEIYAKHIENKDILIWKNKPNEPVWKMRNWCKMSVLEKFGLRDRVFNEDLADSWAGAIFLRKSDFSSAFINEWLQICCVYEDITDARSTIPNSKEFREHRHDQSLLSVLVYKYNIGLEYFEKKIMQNVRSWY
jgi:galactosyl transferase GMA12/MNN10 family